MAPALQAIVLAASSMILIVSCSAQLAEPPSPSTTAPASAPLKLSGAVYSMQFSIGSTEVSGVIDTGSNLIWTNNCQSFDFPVSWPFDAGKEVVEREYGCGASHVIGVMGKAKLTFEGKPSYTSPALSISCAFMFGCHLKHNGMKACKVKKRRGIVGLGRGELSLVNQLGLHSFSYCLPDHSSASSQKAKGQIKFNDIADPSKDRKEIRLVRSDEEYPASSWYYVELMNIMIGTDWKKEFPKACTKEEVRTGNDEGMMIIDSGSASSWLPAEVFEAIKMRVQETTKVQAIDDKQGHICYNTPMFPDKMDKMVLTFCGGSQMEIPYLYQVKTDNKICLAIKPKEKPMLLGAYQQQGMHMLFNIKENTLSFAKHSACGQSQEENHATV